MYKIYLIKYSEAVDNLNCSHYKQKEMINLVNRITNTDITCDREVMKTLMFLDAQIENVEMKTHKKYKLKLIRKYLTKIHCELFRRKY